MKFSGRYKYIDAPMGEGKAELGKSLTEEKAEFFRHLNNVMANKLIKPSIIMEYVNQYNISMGEE
tara:strand:+ start:248 stop:442 length:195 start_codon:yes stop_codon:yes gene_type:complete